MPVQNLFNGVNPHLNSFLQSDGGGWESFHATAIERLTDELDAHLPAGYYVLSEKSLQVSSFSLDPVGPTASRRTIPDISVYTTQREADLGYPHPGSIPTLTLPITAAFEDEEENFNAVVVYFLESGEMPGRPVTRIEILSPANKPGGSHHVTYLARRRETLASGLRLVEIDWLHETPPVVRAIPSYPERASGTYPYWLIISDPRPSVAAGQMAIYGTAVHQPLPTIDVPLEGQDTLAVHFEQIYQRIFESRRLFGMVVDYRQPPVRFETYAPRDQVVIQQRMAEIHAAGGPSPTVQSFTL